MEVLENIIGYLQFKMNRPELYGWFHITSLIVMILMILILIWIRPNVKKTLLVMSTIMILFEIYKQLSFSYNDGIWSYQWYAFPFQFCSVPMYVGFIVGITKNKKLENALYSFLATFSLIAGLSVMLYPNTVFTSEVLINVQTMIHHGFMIIMGVFVLITNTVKPSFKTLYSAFKIFVVIVLIAISIDVVTYYLNINNGLEMFFISPFHTSELPIFSIIYDQVPYLIFLAIYIVVFTFGSGVSLLVKRIVEKKHS